MKRIAAVITEWRRLSHADVILDRICEPAAWGHKRPFDMQLVSMYVDHYPGEDMARDKAKKHGVAIHDTIAGAISEGGKSIGVDGVLVIGEHGPAADNAKGQQMYPRRRFLDEVAEAFRKYGRIVPVFTDKHFSYEPLFAQWILQTYSHMGIPLMAGSSLPVGWRHPSTAWPMGEPMQKAWAQGYGGLDAYGFHTLETLQCQVERRRGGETGVQAVRSLGQGDAAWNHPDLPKDLRERFAATYEGRPQQRNPHGQRTGDALWEIRYMDGLIAHVGMFSSEGQIWGFAGQNDQGEIRPVVFELEEGNPYGYGHFGYLTRAIEHLVATGKSPYPAERTYVTTGVLAALLQSRSEGGSLVPTHFLKDLKYEAVEWPFATGKLGTPA